jgi:hypothetical protein
MIYLVKEHKTQELSALKIYNKQRVIQIRKEKDLLMEKHCLDKLKGATYVC